MKRISLDVIVSALRLPAGIIQSNDFPASLKTKTWLITIIGKYYTLKIIEPLLYNIFDIYVKRLTPQIKLIRERHYDLLIILDACRYDVFSQVVHRYLDGYLIPTKSPASVTIDWLREVWGRRCWKDVVYVSAAPHVNKRGLLREFDARKSFLYIEEVWDWGWDEKLSTVPPNRVNLAVRLVRAKLKLRGLRFKKDYKIVVHYVQPHTPYIAFRNTMKAISKSPLVVIYLMLLCVSLVILQANLQ